MDAIMMRYTDQGLVEIPGASEPEDWDVVCAEADARPTRVGDLVGWGRWTAHYEVEIDGLTLHYALAESEEAGPEDLVVCESADGWSLHAPGATDDDIAEGRALALADGPWADDDHHIPESGYADALAELRRRAQDRA